MFPEGSHFKTKEDYFKLPKEEKGNITDLLNTNHDSPKRGLKNAKPCFYIENKGKVDHFGFTPFFRILYKNEILSAIPNDLANEDFKYDYARALFGFTHTTRDGKSDHYASRLNFFPSMISSESKETEEISVTLRSPRPSAISMYLKQNIKFKNYSSYNDNHAKFR